MGYQPSTDIKMQIKEIGDVEEDVGGGKN